MTLSPPVPIVKGTILGVYMPSDRPLPVIGTTSNDVDDIGVCHTSDGRTTTVIDCGSGANEPNMVLHVEATIGGPIDCDNPGVPNNGQAHGNIYTYNSVIKYTCNEGYLISGSHSIVCLATGEWSSTVPKCNIGEIQ